VANNTSENDDDDSHFEENPDTKNSIEECIGKVPDSTSNVVEDHKVKILSRKNSLNSFYQYFLFSLRFRILFQAPLQSWSECSLSP
jgi:hypothetical protein